MNIIKEIEIKNFKSIRQQRIEGCKRINVFVGAPNVGKSNILEALGLFSITGNKLPFSDFVRIGKPTTIFFNGGIENHIEIILNDFFRARVMYDKDGLFVSMQEVRHINDDFENIDDDFKNRNIIDEPDFIDKIIVRGSFFISGGTGEITNLRGDFQLRFHEDQKEDRLNAKVITKVPILKYEFKKDVKYNSNSAWNLNQPYGENIFEIISTKEELNTSIIKILDGYGLKFLYDSESQEYKILKLVGNKIFTVPYFMTADTLRRLIFYEAAILSNKNSVLLFEEPESQMYPPFISKLTSSIINDENENQFFIATHSPFVLNDFMENAKDDLAIYLVDYKKETGETIINKMSDSDMHEAYQFGYDFFLNIKQFLPQST